MAKRLNIEEIEEQREMNKFSLETFVESLPDNIFDETIGELFEKLRDALNEEIRKYNSKPYSEEDQYFLDTSYWDEKLYVIGEMMIVYCYKEYEINLAKLLSGAYNVEWKNLYRWDYVKDILKDKNIQFDKLVGFNEINELREVNNAIKHSSILEHEKSSKIKEFKEKRFIYYHDLKAFYERIKVFPYKYLNALSEAIYKDLYVFSNNRLNGIAELFAVRMDKMAAEKFVTYLESKY